MLKVVHRETVTVWDYPDRSVPSAWSFDPTSSTATYEGREVISTHRFGVLIHSSTYYRSISRLMLGNHMLQTVHRETVTVWDYPDRSVSSAWSFDPTSSIALYEGREVISTYRSGAMIHTNTYPREMPHLIPSPDVLGALRGMIGGSSAGDGVVLDLGPDAATVGVVTPCVGEDHLPRGEPEIGGPSLTVPDDAMEEGPKVPVVVFPTRESGERFADTVMLVSDDVSLEEISPPPRSPPLFIDLGSSYSEVEMYEPALPGDPEEDVDDGYAEVFTQVGEDSGGGIQGVIARRRHSFP
jgi:hypothetical protein